MLIPNEFDSYEAAEAMSGRMEIDVEIEQAVVETAQTLDDSTTVEPEPLVEIEEEIVAETEAIAPEPPSVELETGDTPSRDLQTAPDPTPDADLALDFPDSAPTSALRPDPDPGPRTRLLHPAAASAGPGSSGGIDRPMAVLIA